MWSQGGPVRVGVSGAPGVGKSTLLRRLAERFRSVRVTVSTEAARVLVNQGVRINTESETEDYLAFLTHHARQMRVLSGDLILLDRTFLDVLCFMEMNGNAKPWLRNLTEELVLSQMPLLRCYFYLPPEFESKADGIRLVDPVAIGRFDRVLRRRLAEFRPNATFLRGAVAERVELAVSEINASLRSGRTELS